MASRVFIIAEAGVNHNGSVELARKMVDVASDAGVDAVKFQTFKAAEFVSRHAEKADYQKQTTSGDESQMHMIRRLELDAAAHEELLNYCRQKGVQFLSSPFDLESIELLHSLGLKILKIPSGEITNLPYLRRIGQLRKKVILSTGMADLKEIEEALHILINAGTEKKDITVLHCNTEYPTPIEHVDLRAMLTIKKAFQVKIGYSDHTLGIEIPIAAVALGANVIEKHFTLDKNMKGPDHQASIEPHELKAMVQGVRNVEIALGTGIKKPNSSELKNRLVARKSVVAARAITKGEIYTEDNITVKRPGIGISPMRWDEILGKKAPRNFEEDEIIQT